MFMDVTRLKRILIVEGLKGKTLLDKICAWLTFAPVYQCVYFSLSEFIFDYMHYSLASWTGILKKIIWLLLFLSVWCIVSLKSKSFQHHILSVMVLHSHCYHLHFLCYEVQFNLFYFPTPGCFFPPMNG